MPTIFSTLNDRQVEVLRWIGDGCPDGTMEGYSHKTTAIALANRRLVTVSKKGGVWRATISSAGAHYLRYGNHPTARPPNRKAPTDPPIAPLPLLATGVVAHRHSRMVQKDAQPKKLQPTEQLIMDLLTQGEITVSGPERAKYEARVAAAIRFGKVPEGKQLVTEGGRWSREYVIRLREAPAWLHAPLSSILVPSTLRQPDPVVIALQSGNRLTDIDRSPTHRALLLIQALVVEARRRGYGVKETTVTTDRYGFERRETDDHFGFTIGGHSVGVRLRQLMNRTRHEPTPADQAKATNDPWYRISKYDVTPSDRLRIQLSGRFEHRQSQWTDGPAGLLEDWLPQIIQEVELRAGAAERERLADISAAQERRQQWERAMEKARADHAESYRANVLVHQVDRWFRARQMREYLDGMQERIEIISDPDESLAAKEWHRWAVEWVASTDPLAQLLAMPAVPEPKPDDLTPFVKGWNPYGPERSMR